MRQTDPETSSSSPEAEGVRMHMRDIELYRGTARTLAVDQLEIPANALTAVVGLSGSGKTTLIECLSGALRPQTGEITVDGQSLSRNLNKHQRELAYVPQENIVHDEVTVKQALDFAAVLRLGDEAFTDRIEDRIETLLSRLRLNDVRDHRIRNLSGGQRKRVYTATEMVSSTRLLLLDEPTAGLDPAHHHEFMTMLREVADQGCTVVVTTHQTDLLDLCDKLVFIENGTVIEQDTPDDVLKRNQCDTFNELFQNILIRDRSPEPEEADTGFLESLLLPVYPLYLVVKGLLFWGFVLVRDFLRILYTALRASLTGPLKSVGFALRNVLPRFFVLLHREQVVLFQHRAFLGYLLALPAAVGLLIGLVSGVHLDPARTVFLSLVASFWLGINTSALSIIRELPIVEKERMASPYKETYVVTYLSSKLVWYGLLGLLVGGVLIGGLYVTGRIHYAPFGKSFRILATIGIIELAALLGVVIGLLVSTVSENQVFAMSLVPLIVLPGLLLSRVALNKTPYEPVGTPEVETVSDGAEQETSQEEQDRLLSPVWYWMYRIHPVSFLYDGAPLTLRPEPDQADRMKREYVRNVTLYTVLPSVVMAFILYFLTHLILLFRGRL